jgi:NADH-quinone oxidoreductase subunit I
MATIPFAGILKSLWVTARTVFRKPVTVQYPVERPPYAERMRGFPALIWDEAINEPFCTGCQVCARYCPTNAIFVTMKDNPLNAAGESPRRKIVDDFYLDIGRCIQCKICVDVCNFDAIYMSHETEFSEWDKSELVFDLKQMLHLKEQANPRTKQVVTSR